jgi:hypothetical protein
MADELVVHQRPRTCILVHVLSPLCSCHLCLNSQFERIESQAYSGENTVQWTRQNRVNDKVPGKHVAVCQCCFEADSADWEDYLIVT